MFNHTPKAARAIVLHWARKMRGAYDLNQPDQRINLLDRAAQDMRDELRYQTGLHVPVAWCEAVIARSMRIG